MVRSPLISSELMQQRMEGRKAVRIRNVASEVKNGDVPGDWVVFGVVVDKLPPRCMECGGMWHGVWGHVAWSVGACGVECGGVWHGVWGCGVWRRVEWSVGA